jgi:hypothetical protein
MLGNNEKWQNLPSESENQQITFLISKNQSSVAGSIFGQLGEQVKPSEMMAFFMPDSWEPLISLKIREAKILNCAVRYSPFSKTNKSLNIEPIISFFPLTSTFLYK